LRLNHPIFYKFLKHLKSQENRSRLSFGEYLHAIFKEEIIKEEFVKQLISEGFNDIEIYEEAPTIEDCFMDLMRKK